MFLTVFLWFSLLCSSVCLLSLFFSVLLLASLLLCAFLFSSLLSSPLPLSFCLCSLARESQIPFRNETKTHRADPNIARVETKRHSEPRQRQPVPEFVLISLASKPLLLLSSSVSDSSLTCSSRLPTVSIPPPGCNCRCSLREWEVQRLHAIHGSGIQ